MLVQNSSNLSVGDYIIDLFKIPFVFNFWTVILLLAYLAFFTFGYWLISGQVKLVKKEVWNGWDRFRCLIFSFFYASGVIIIISMMITFTITSFVPPDSPVNASTAFFILIPFTFCLMFLTVYPLFDFLYMASHEENVALSRFQEVFEPLIKRFKRPFRYIVAIVLYFIVFLAPPLIMILVFHWPFLFVWVFWMLLFPMYTLSYFAGKGYVTGVIHQYNAIPSIGRTAFLLFEPGTRLTDEALHDPAPRILTWIMIFFYFWTGYNIITIFLALIPWYIPPSTMSGIMVYVTLTMGITGYFTRYWSWKVKINMIDLMFASFLISAIGVNVLINFSLVNITLLDAVFNEWILTEGIFVPQIGEVAAITQYKNFAFAINIERIVLFIYMNIYIWKKPKTFINDTVYSEMTKYGENFQPVPLFNECRSSEKFQRDHVMELLLRMYTRVPVKQGYDINDPLIANPLFDAICDYHPYVQQAGKQIFEVLIKEHPEKMKSLVENQIQSPNFDKVRKILHILSEKGEKMIPFLSLELIIQMLTIPEIHIKQEGVKILNQKMLNSDPNLLVGHLDQLLALLNDPDFETQALIMELLSKIPNALPSDVISDRLNHPNLRIKTAATKALGSVDFSKMGESAADTLISMLESPNPQILASAMFTLSQFKDLSKFKIPLQPFIDNLINQNLNVREAAGAYISRLLDSNTVNIKFDRYISKFFDLSIGVQKTLLPLLGKCWKSIPEVIPLCIQALRSDEVDINEQASNVFIMMAKDAPEKIINILLNEQETESFIRMGKIASVITKICKNAPEKGITLMTDSLNSPKENVKINASTVLGALSNNFAKQIPLKPLLNIWFQDPNPKIKKEIAKAVSNIAASQPETIKPLMPTILKGLSDQDNSVRLTVAKLFVDLGEKSPDLIPFGAIKTMTEDKDSYIRENGLKLLAITAKRYPKEAIQVVYQCLKDPEWNVKNAAADAIGKMGQNIDDIDVLNGLKQMITDKEKWVRIKALGIISKVIESHPNLINYDEIVSMIQKETEPDVIMNMAKIFGATAADHFTQALPLILKLLSHSERNVREGMIAGMVNMSVRLPITTFVPVLLKYLSDDTELVLQQSIALLLRRILRYEGEDLKKRAISMLKIRSDVTQDPTLSEVLSDLQASIKK